MTARGSRQRGSSMTSNYHSLDCQPLQGRGQTNPVGTARQAFCSLTESGEDAAKTNAFLAKAPALYYLPPPEGGLHRRDEEMPARRLIMHTLSCVSFKQSRAEEEMGTQLLFHLGSHTHQSWAQTG